MKMVIVNDIDGRAYHTVFYGTPEEAKATFADHPLAHVVDRVIGTGETEEETYYLNGEQYTAGVLLSEQ